MEENMYIFLGIDVDNQFAEIKNKADYEISL